jgi:hypothetical protein
MPPKRKFLSSGPSRWIVDVACIVALLSIATSRDESSTNWGPSKRSYAIGIAFVASSVAFAWLVFEAPVLLWRQWKGETPVQPTDSEIPEVRIIHDDEL